jgi:hypothetical protein
MKPALKFAAATFLLIVLSACASLAPNTFNEKLTVAYSSVTAVRTSTTTLLQGDKISVKDAENIQATANDVRTGLDIARELHKTLPEAGEDKLAVTLVILQHLQKYVEEKK